MKKHKDFDCLPLTAGSVHTSGFNLMKVTRAGTRAAAKAAFNSIGSIVVEREGAIVEVNKAGTVLKRFHEVGRIAQLEKLKTLL